LALLARFMILLNNFTHILALLARFEGRQGRQLRHLPSELAVFTCRERWLTSGCPLRNKERPPTGAAPLDLQQLGSALKSRGSPRTPPACFLALMPTWRHSRMMLMPASLMALAKTAWSFCRRLSGKNAYRCGQRSSRKCSKYFSHACLLCSRNANKVRSVPEIWQKSGASLFRTRRTWAFPNTIGHRLCRVLFGP